MTKEERLSNDDAWQDAIWCNHLDTSCTQELSRMTIDQIDRIQDLIIKELLHRAVLDE